MSQHASSSWPSGSVPFAVEELVEAARQLELEADAGLTVDPCRVEELITSLSAYVDSLPPDLQTETSRRLVEAICHGSVEEATTAEQSGV